MISAPGRGAEPGGTQLCFRSDTTPDELDVTIASLDDPASMPPRDHIFVRSRLPWVRPDGLPEHAAARHDA